MSGQSLFLESTENDGRSAQVDRFLAARGAGSGRLIFALDATASRKLTWDIAGRLTGDMIREAASSNWANFLRRSRCSLWVDDGLGRPERRNQHVASRSNEEVKEAGEKTSRAPSLVVAAWMTCI